MKIWRMRIACCMRKATNTHSECVILIVFFFYCNNGCTNASQCHVVRTLPVALRILPVLVVKKKPVFPVATDF